MGVNKISTDLETLAALQNPFKAREEIAKELLLRETHIRPKGKYLYFGIVGIDFEGEYDFIFNETSFGSIKPVRIRAGEIELAGACKNKNLFSYYATYTRIIAHELAIKIVSGDHRGALNTAFLITSLIKIKSESSFLVPLCCSTSFETIPFFKDGTCELFTLDDYSKAFLNEKAHKISKEDLDWVNKYFKPTDNNLLKDEKFLLAREILCESNKHPNLRIMIAHLWTGIEALFDIHGEITYRLSLYIALLLNTSPAKIETFNEVKKLYSERSKIVHGKNISEKNMIDHYQKVRHILAALLKITIENGKVYDRDEIDKRLLS